MATKRQLLGEYGEKLVVRKCTCPKCKREKTLRRLPKNFKSSDIICNFCGFLAQVTTTSVKDVSVIPDKILGAAWGPQEERMNSSIYFPLYIVLRSEKKQAIYYLAVDFQERKMFFPRNPLSGDAKRAGWQGFYYVFDDSTKSSIIRLV